MIFPGTPGRFSDCNHALCSNVGKGPKGDGIIADVVRDDPYGVYRIQFKNSKTGEVYLTTPNMDPGSRIYFCMEELTYGDDSYIVPFDVFSPQQVGTIRDARVGDIVFYKLHKAETSGTNAIGIGIITNISLQDQVTFMQHAVLDIGDIDEIDARIQEIQRIVEALPDYSEFVTMRTELDEMHIELDKKPFVFDTVAEMQECASLTVGVICETKGHHIINDLGGMCYKVVASVQEGIYYEELNNGLYAIPIFLTPYVTPEMFGAIGDGVTDDTQAVNAALQYHRVLLNGTYKISERLRPVSDSLITGTGSIVQYVEIWVFNCIHLSNVTFDGFTIDCSNVNRTGETNHGFVIVDCNNLAIRNCKILHTKADGIYVGTWNVEENHNENITIEGCEITYFERQGITAIEGDNIVIAHNKMVNSTTFILQAIDMEPEQPYENATIFIHDNELINCNISQYIKASVVGESLQNDYYLNIHNNYIEINNTEATYSCISIENARDLVIEGNILITANLNNLRGIVTHRIHNNMIIANNTITGNNCMYLTDNPLSTKCNLSITGNKITRHSAGWACTIESEGGLFANNIISNGGLYWYCGEGVEQFATITGNIIHNENFLNGILLTRFLRATICNNIVEGQQSSINLSSVETYIAMNNILKVGTSGYAIQKYQSTPAEGSNIIYS